MLKLLNSKTLLHRQITKDLRGVKFKKLSDTFLTNKKGLNRPKIPLALLSHSEVGFFENIKSTLCAIIAVPAEEGGGGIHVIITEYSVLCIYL
jgi:hypothetical protein